MEEVWKDIEGYEGFFKINNHGIVKDIYRETREIVTGKYDNGGILKYDVGNYGKKRVMIWGKKHMVHILVAKAFPEICGVWFEGCQVHHKDRNPSNNNADNLICLTPEEHNLIHTQMGLYKGENCFWYGKHFSEKHKMREAMARRKPIIQMDLEGNEIMGWLSCTDCERETGMQKAGINRCCLGKQNTSYGYKWRYAS